MTGRRTRSRVTTDAHRGAGTAPQGHPVQARTLLAVAAVAAVAGVGDAIQQQQAATLQLRRRLEHNSLRRQCCNQEVQ